MRETGPANNTTRCSGLNKRHLPQLHVTEDVDNLRISAEDSSKEQLVANCWSRQSTHTNVLTLFQHITIANNTKEVILNVLNSGMMMRSTFSLIPLITL